MKLQEELLRVRTQKKTAEAVISEILMGADKLQMAGNVSRGLVGAMLAIRFPNVRVGGASKGGWNPRSKTDSGYFEIENSVFEVAVGLPYDKNLDRIESILKRPGREVWIITREDRVAIWKSEVAKRFGRLVRRIVVTSVESFVGQNISELAEFSSSGKTDRLKQLVDLYNSKWVETVGSANIRISLE